MKLESHPLINDESPNGWKGVALAVLVFAVLIAIGIYEVIKHIA